MNKQQVTHVNPIVNLIVVVFLGIFGVHKFMNKQIGMGILYLCTGGLCGIGWIYDIIVAIKQCTDSRVITIKRADIQKAESPILPKISAPMADYMAEEMSKIDLMSIDGFAFENYCAELLKANEFTNVEVTQGSGDFGIDVLAEKEGITYAIQCKCYSNPVGNKSVQEAYTGKEYYKRMVAVVMTNSTFTSAAVETANETRVMLWDRKKLQDFLAYRYIKALRHQNAQTNI